MPRSVFSDMEATIAELRSDRLMGVARTYMPDLDVSDRYLTKKLLAAERQVERELRVFLTPREILPQAATEEERAAAPGYFEEPGYDYNPALFQGDTWGRIDTRQRPIIAVHKIVFAYPSLQSPTLTIPKEWVRLDRKYGTIQLVPAQNVAIAGLSSYIMSALGGGLMVPWMIQVYYRAGLENAEEDFPDILDVVQKQAVLGVLEDQFSPSSASTSTDGMSQSVSMEADKYQGGIARRLKTLRQSINGIVMGVM